MSETTSQFAIVFVTVPSAEIARRMAEEVVESRLGACAKIFPGVTSIYRWRETVEEAIEQQLVIKTRRECFERLRDLIVSIHPYKVPEIVAIPVVDGLPSYLEWIRDATLID